ncbi:MAG: hypothetical protein HY341_00080 [Candidatus Kerfeldbacteria bacterium]|nr:hypothetical protein [Candidatus Kerfeldbacteria bacterium]
MLLVTLGLFLIGSPVFLYVFLFWRGDVSPLYAFLAMPLWGGLAMFLTLGDPLGRSSVWPIILPFCILFQLVVLVLVAEGSFRIRTGWIRDRRSFIVGVILLVVVWGASFAGTLAVQYAVRTYDAVSEQDVVERIVNGTLPVEDCRKLRTWEACVRTVAAERADPDLCTMLPTARQFSCQVAVIEQQGSTAPCLDFTEPLYRAACVGAFAASSQDVAVCNDLTARDERAACQRSAARSVCGENPLLAIRTVCSDDLLAAWGLSPRTGVVE